MKILKKMSLIRLLFPVSMVAAMLPATGFEYKATTGTLFIELSNVEPSKGCVSVRLYNSEASFLQKGNACHQCKSKVSNEPAITVSFKEVPLGTYAVAAYYDKNCNDKMDKSWTGLPSEPYGFSKPFHKKTRKPRFEEVNFRFEKSGQVVKIAF